MHTDAVSASRRVPLGKLGLGIIAGFVLALGFGSGAIFAYQGQYAARIYPGVTVAGVDVAGLTRDAARVKLETALGGYGQGTAVVAANGTTIRIAYSSVGRRADIGTLVDLAWSVGRSEAGPLQQAAQGVRSLIDGTRIDPRVLVDPDLVAAEVSSAAAVVDRQPVDATASASGTGFVATPATSGRGLDREALARTLLARLADPAAPATLEIAADTVPLEPAVSDADAAAAVQAAGRMAKVVVLTHGKETWKIPAATVRSWITFAADAGGYHPTVAPDAPVKALTALAKKVDQAAKDATFVVGRGSAPVGVIAGRNGRALDITASAQAVADAVIARAAGATADVPPVALAIATVEPKVTTAEAQKTAPLMRRLSTWTTYYDVSASNGFGANITIPARTIDGYVVAPGAVFDFWSAIEPVTYARGYRDGGVIINGHSEPTGALAGGICSCSTTLFNAAARAGLAILERHNHYYYISRYPTGLDATVVKDGSSVKDMRFRNDTKYPILIRGYASPGVVRFDIWGPSTGRTVAFSRPTIRNVNRASDSVQYTTSLAPGVRKRVEYPVDGMQVWVTRTVRDASGKIIHQETWYSNYKRVDGLLLVGRKAAPAPTPAPSPVPTPSPTPTP